MQLGLIKKEGKIQGYRTPEHLAHKKQFIERELKEKLSKEQIRIADHSLEFRVRWLFETVGYGSSSCDIQDGDRMPACSKIPTGCEIPEIVSRSIAVLEKMISIGGIGRSYAYILNTVYYSRRGNETLSALFSRLNFQFSYKQFLAARKMYSNIFHS